MTSSAIWIAITVSSIAMIAMRIFGYFIPAHLMTRDRVLRITALIPIVLLAALVAVQTLTIDGEITIDHRTAGVLAGAIALSFKRSFLTVMLVAGVTGSFFYNFL